jgi:hypothetical protein
MGGDAPIDFEFCGYACLPANPMGECLDAAGIDARARNWTNDMRHWRRPSND